MTSLFEKYLTAAPRYSTYPAVSDWTNTPSEEKVSQNLSLFLQNSTKSISYYIHIPFCETLCTFCGCNTSITKNHFVEEPYTEAIQKEIELYRKEVPELQESSVADIHLGGGTPTYLSEYNLERIIKTILPNGIQNQKMQFSLEVDPRRTRKTQLKLLADLGFKRVKFGVQDFSQEVQRMVNREQSFELTESMVTNVKSLGYESICIELIYGLPKQSIESIQETLRQTIILHPDQIAFYPYIHVPWIKNSQRLFTQEDLPKSNEKRKLFEFGREFLLDAGYIEIGMDLYALKTDYLTQAKQENKLYRNFTGFTDKKTDILLGLGSSAISETPDLYFQNQKLESSYRKFISKGNHSFFRGHTLSQDDKMRKSCIRELMTVGKTKLIDFDKPSLQTKLSHWESDGIVRLENGYLEVTPLGLPFLRTILTSLDGYLSQ